MQTRIETAAAETAERILQQLLESFETHRPALVLALETLHRVYPRWHLITQYLGAITETETLLRGMLHDVSDFRKVQQSPSMHLGGAPVFQRAPSPNWKHRFSERYMEQQYLEDLLRELYVSASDDSEDTEPGAS